MTSRIVCLFGWSRSSLRSATVTSSQPDASRAASIDSSVGYLPVPRNKRDRSSTPAITSRFAAATVCMPPAYRRVRSGQVLLDQEGLVSAVAQALDGVLDRKPQQPVDLDPRAEPAALHFHHPVARDLVPPAAVDVCGAAQRALQLTLEAGFLADLAQRAVLSALIRLDLAFGQGPVVVGWAMNHGDLGLA